MFDKDNNKPALKTTGVLNLLDGFWQFNFSQMSLSSLEQVVLILNSMKREADALSNDGNGGSRVVISGFYLNDWIEDAMTVYNNTVKLMDSVNKTKE